MFLSSCEYKCANGEKQAYAYHIRYVMLIYDNLTTLEENIALQNLQEQCVINNRIVSGNDVLSSPD